MLQQLEMKYNIKKTFRIKNSGGVGSMHTRISFSTHNSQRMVAALLSNVFCSPFLCITPSPSIIC